MGKNSTWYNRLQMNVFIYIIYLLKINDKTILVSILALVFAVLISPNFLHNSQGQRTGDLPLDKSIEREREFLFIFHLIGKS